MKTPLNFTVAEVKKFNKIKAACLAGKSRTVSHEDRQWVLDMMKRESVSANNISILNQAKAEGLNVDGILVKA